MKLNGWKNHFAAQKKNHNVLQPIWSEIYRPYSVDSIQAHIKAQGKHSADTESKTTTSKC